MMKLLTLITLLLLLITFTISAQTTNTVPINWQKYKISHQNVSVSFPKMPVLVWTSDYCNEQMLLNYGVYANGVVYGFRITSKPTIDSSKYCTNVNKFSEDSFSNYLQALKKDMLETKVQINGREVIKLTKDINNHWLINDYANKRWFEFWVVGANEEKKEVADFIASLKLGKTSEGIEIEEGSSSSLGDEKIENPYIRPGTSALILPLKPRANYTEAARKNQVQGTVTLRVIFKADGSIGAVTPISGLADGLTEEAVKAAKRIVFIPAQRDGVLMTVVKQVQYTFTLY